MNMDLKSVCFVVVLLCVWGTKADDKVNETVGLRCYFCSATGGDNMCEQHSTYKAAMDGKGLQTIKKNCTAPYNKMCMIETFAVLGNTVSHIRDCSDGETFSFSSNLQANRSAYLRLQKLQVNNETACVWDGQHQVCLTKCNGTFCNGPKLTEVNMFPADILGSWTVWSKLSGNGDDDWVDRLSHIYTVVILVVFSVFVAGGSYVGDPISCWHPAEYPGSHVKYANTICWIQNTYYVPLDEVLPQDGRLTRELEITYYQYVPLILLFMAFLFKIPSLIWRNLSSYSGLELPKVVEMTLNAHYVVDDDKRADRIREIAGLIDRWLEANRQYHWNCLVRIRQHVARLCFCMNRREGTYLTGLYLLVKFLFALNVISQFFIMDGFLGGFFSFWGIEAMYSLAHEYEMKESKRFPRVTMCDFKVRLFSKIQEHTSQCVLPFNLFNEKIFLFLWFWYVLVSVITCANLGFWIWRSLLQRNRVSFVKKHLTISSKIHTAMDKKLCKKFATYLRDDGIFLMQIVKKNSNDILITELIAKLWDIFQEKPQVRKMTTLGGDNGNNNTTLRSSAPPLKTAPPLKADYI